MSRTCDACGKSFGSLTALRLHERDGCLARKTYGEIDPDAPDVGQQGAEELLTCRECGHENPAGEDHGMSFADGDLHYIVRFQCRFCGFENENRLVLTGVDKSNLDDLPPHLRPDDTEVGE